MSKRQPDPKPSVVCLRPKADFERVGVVPPATLDIEYMSADDGRLASVIASADALVIPAVGPKLPPNLFRDSRVKLVQVTGTGYDRLDVEALRALRIPVANVAGGSNDAIAEYSVSCACALLRRFPEMNAEIRKGRYGEIRSRYVSENADGLGGLLAGIVGLGTIGAVVAERFKQFGCRIAYYDPSPAARTAAAALGAQALPFNELIAQADIISVHVPLLPATRDLIDARAIARAKSSAVLIQVSRGGVVNELALAQALEEARLAGAAVDVYGEEPPGPDNPLLNLSDAAAARAILTPHIAGITRQSWAQLFGRAWENVCRVVLENRPPVNVV